MARGHTLLCMAMTRGQTLPKLASCSAHRGAMRGHQPPQHQGWPHDHGPPRPSPARSRLKHLPCLLLPLMRRPLKSSSCLLLPLMGRPSWGVRSARVRSVARMSTAEMKVGSVSYWLCSCGFQNRSRPVLRR
eukprot:362951-Chlamydomonas_euryale.AAC.3